MATVNFSLRTNKNPANIYCRFVVGRKTNLAIPIGIFIDPSHWDKSHQKVRNLIKIKNRDQINQNLLRLKAHVFENYNTDYSTGEIIDKFWLEKTCRSFFSRPKHENSSKIQKHKIYYTDFALWWLQEKAKTWLVGQDRYMNDREIAKYTFFIGMVKNYQGKELLKIKNITSVEISDFVRHLADNGYASKTIKRHIGRFKFFLNRAEELNLNINNGFKQRVFTPKIEDVKKPYLNEDEIEAIFNLDLSDDNHLDNIRDNFVIGLWSGLRISDFNNNLNIENIRDGYIEIKTVKTGTWVSIPLHDHVKSILAKRFNNLPQKISDQKFNKGIKTICFLCNIEEEMVGEIYDKDTKRNRRGVYPKYKLITSHTARRSWCTNLYGKVSNSVIQKVGGWSTESMMLLYMKKTSKEHAKEIQKYWDSKKI